MTNSTPSSTASNRSPACGPLVAALQSLVQL
ncbi:hypothetical protein RSAG8_08184, partial [Rhizoctonia solani AG-8 WAC10335]